MGIIIMRKSTLRKKLVEATRNGQDAGIMIGKQLERGEIKGMGVLTGLAPKVRLQLHEIMERKGL